MDIYEHIHNATDARLAEMIEDYGFDIALTSPELGAIMGEAARRLKASRPVPFNSEAFDV